MSGAVARIGRRRAGVPVIRQMTPTECGAACLAMVLGYFGRAVRVQDVRDVLDPGRDGATFRGLLGAGRGFGLRGRGVRVEVAELDVLPPASILHWEFQHFVVLERVRGGQAEIVDPALGRRRVPLAQLGRSFTGAALVFEPSEVFAPGGPPPTRLWGRLRRALGASDLLGRIVVTSLLLQLFALATPALTSAVVDRVIGRGDVDLLWVIGAGIAGLLLFQAVTAAVRAHLLLHLRTRLDVGMTMGFAEHLLHLPFAFFQRRSAGDLGMRLGSNAAIREILAGGALSALLDGSLVVGYLAVLAWASPALAALVLGLGGAQVGVFLAARARQRELLARDLEAQARRQSYEVEMLTGIEALKAMGVEDRAYERWSDLFVDATNVALERGRLAAALEAVASSLRLGSPLVILLFGARMVLAGEVSLGEMLGLTAVAGGLLGPLASLVASAGQLQLLRSYTDRTDDVLETAPERRPAPARVAGRLRGGVRLEGVSFRYGPLAAPVIRDVSLAVEPGQFVAIVGRSGSGKSTLAALMIGLHAPVEGRVLLDEDDLAGLDLGSVRGQLGVVTQQPSLFSTSVRDNIAAGAPSATLAEIMTAADAARIHEEIGAMPMRYDTALGDRGTALSGGQRQRIALARAIVRRPAILVLDEATSALDATTEAAIQDNLQALRCTRIVIAHRLSTVRHADRIFVLEDGRLVEQGTHDELMTIGGAYARQFMVQQQS